MCWVQCLFQKPHSSPPTDEQVLHLFIAAFIKPLDFPLAVRERCTENTVVIFFLSFHGIIWNFPLQWLIGLQDGLLAQ